MQQQRSRVRTLAACLSFLQLLVSAECFSHFNRPGRLSCQTQPRRRAQTCGSTKRAVLHMDVEHGLHERRLLQRLGFVSHLEGSQRRDSLSMPWRESILPHQYTEPATRRKRRRNNDEVFASSLLYMPFWNQQLQFMEDNLTNLRRVHVEDELSYQENEDGTARIVNYCFASDEYRKIRMTYYDAGDKTQVFNSLWYPALRYDAPVVGIDLLAFNRQPDVDMNGIRGKYLSVVDYQPIHETNDDSSITPFSNALGDIRNDYPSLQGKMSARFYDEKRHFSSGMLFGRCEKEDFVDGELFPAFERSMVAHLKLLQAMPSDDGNTKSVLSGQASYDSYSSVRDPAMALFTKMFGEEWATRYVYDFLFSLSEREAVKKEVDLIAKARSK